MMACAPHLSFLIEVLSCVMVWIARPRVGWGRGCIWVGVIFVGVCCGRWVRGRCCVSMVGGGNIVVACWSASLMVLVMWL